VSKRNKRTRITKASGEARHSISASADHADPVVACAGTKAMKWIEAGVTAVLLLILIALHVIVFQESGALWRDEVNSVNLSTLPSLLDVWENLQFDSFPMLWLLLLRAWIFMGFGGTDLGLRALGLITGIGTLAALWFAARSLRVRLPMVSFVLFAMSSTAFLCDSLRAYGLGVIFILLALGTMWRVCEDPVPWKMVVSAMMIILSVQCLYLNSVLVFAICAGAAAVGLHRRNRNLMIFPLGAGLLAAASLLPYLGMISGTSDWNIIIKIPVDVPWVLGKFRQAIDPSGSVFVWIWTALWLLALASWAFQFFTAAVPGRPEAKRDLSLFLLTTMFVGIIAYAAFIKILSYPTQSWHYLPVLAVLAVAMDKGIDIVCESKLTLRIVRMILLLGIAAFVFTNAWNAVHIRKTNMDVLASRLEALVHKDDLIVVYPFYYGISFSRYYSGSAEWSTLPEMEDHRVHRYDLFKSRMMESEPLSPLLQRMSRTLKEGHRVWLVGGLHFLRRGEIPRVLPPAPASPYAWSEAAYQSAWSQMAAFTLQTHGNSVERIKIPLDKPVQPFEDVPLMVVQGWHP
jgi:MFS family permease